MVVGVVHMREHDQKGINISSFVEFVEFLEFAEFLEFNEFIIFDQLQANTSMFRRIYSECLMFIFRLVASKTLPLLLS